MVRIMKFEQILSLLCLLTEIISSINIIMISYGNRPQREILLNTIFINFFLLNSIIGVVYSLILWRTYPIGMGKIQYVLHSLMLLKICCFIGIAESGVLKVPLLNTLLGIYFQSSLSARSINRPYIIEGIICSIYATASQCIEYVMKEFPRTDPEVNLWSCVCIFSIICIGNIWLQIQEKYIKQDEKQINIPLKLHQKDLQIQIQNDRRGLSQSKIEELQNEKNDISQGTPINDDEAILKQYCWIKRLQFIVFDQDLNIILQTFSLDLFLQNQNISQLNTSDQEQVQLILKHHIVSCNLDLYRVCEENNEQLSNKSLFGYNEEQRFFPSQPLSLENLMLKILFDYNKYKQCVFQIHKLDTQKPELQTTNLKLFMSQIKNKPFIFLQFNKNEKIQMQPTNQNSILRLFRSMQSTYIELIALYLNCVTTLSTLAEYDVSIDQEIKDLYISPIRHSATEMYLQIANVQDYNLFLQNQMNLRIAQIKMQDTLFDVVGLLGEALEAKGIKVKLEINEFEDQQNNIIYTDPERIRQLIYILLKRSLNQTPQGQINIQLTQMNSTSVSILITDSGSGMNTKELRQMINQINKYSFSQSVAALEVTTKGISEYQDLVIAQVIARKLSGSYKKGIDINSEKHKGTQYYFILETQTYSMESPQNSTIKVLPNQKYFETSLSQLLGQQSEYSKFVSSASKFPDSNYFPSKEKSFQFSLSLISRQQSQFKQDQISSVYQTFKGQESSAHSKIQVNSNSLYLSNPINNTNQPVMLFPNLNSKQYGSEYDSSQKKGSNFSLKPQSQIKVSKIDEEEISFNKESNVSIVNLSKQFKQSTESQQIFKNNIKLVLDGFSVSGGPQSPVDMGTDTLLSLQIPQSDKPKFLGQILRYKLNTKCCTKVLIAGNEYSTMRMIQVLLNFYQIQSHQAFTNEQAFKLIDQKQQNSCKCGNKSYLLYFVDYALPPRGGPFFSKNIRDSINQNQLDNAVIIGIMGITSLDFKMECIKNGMDHYLGLPLDLSQFHQIMQFFQGNLQ